MSATEEQWHEWQQQQLTALAVAEAKAAGHEEDAGAGSRAESQGQPRPRASSQLAEGSAGVGLVPLALEQRFMVDRAALPKGVGIDPLVDIPSVSIDGAPIPVQIAMMMPPRTRQPRILPAVVATMTMPSHPVLLRRCGLPPTPSWRSSRIG